MIPYVAQVLAAILYVSPALSEDTARRYAEDYASVAADLDEAFALVATARVEGTFDPDVETCRRTGDHGRSVSMFQLRHFWRVGFTRAEVCKSNRLAAWLALGVLRYHGFDRSPERAFRRYVGCKPADERATSRVTIYRRLRRLFG